MEPATAPLADQEPGHQLTGLKICKAAQWASCLLMLIPITILVQEIIALERIESAGGWVKIPRQPPQWLSWAGEAGRLPLVVPYSSVKLQGCPVDDKTWQAVLHLAGRGLEVALLDGTGLTDRQLAELTERSPDLEQLEIRDSRLTNQGLGSLASCRQLTVLAISSPELNPGWVKQLAPLTSLRLIRLSGLEWNQETTTVFSSWTRLECLQLTEVTFPQHLLDGYPSAWGPSIRWLSIHDASLTEAGLEIISSCSELRGLNFTNVTFPAAGCQHLSRLKHLKHISLHRCRISDESAAQLGACHGLTDITFVDCPINGSCLRALSTLPEVSELELRGSTIEDSSLQHLADFPKLESLDLSETSVSDAAVPHLVQCRRLKHLHLSDSQISASGLELLRESLPDCKVSYYIP